jgi:hypothetical protein
MHGDVTLVKVCNHSLRVRAWYLMVGIEAVALFYLEVVFRHQHCDRSTLWVIVLRGDVQNISADNLGDIRQNFSQAFGIVNFVNIFDVCTLVLGADGIAYGRTC